MLLYEGPADDDGQPITQVVPASERFKDFLLRVEDLIGALSVIENRPAGDILLDMLNQPIGDGLAAPTTNGVKAGWPSAL